MADHITEHWSSCSCIIVLLLCKTLINPSVQHNDTPENNADIPFDFTDKNYEVVRPFLSPYWYLPQRVRRYDSNTCLWTHSSETETGEIAEAIVLRHLLRYQQNSDYLKLQPLHAQNLKVCNLSSVSPLIYFLTRICRKISDILQYIRAICRQQRLYRITQETTELVQWFLFWHLLRIRTMDGCPFQQWTR